jgi:predicted nuclease with TOPRIM domain
MGCTDTKYPRDMEAEIHDGHERIVLKIDALKAENERLKAENNQLERDRSVRNQTWQIVKAENERLKLENERLERAKEELWAANKRLRELADSLRAEGESYPEALQKANGAELKPTQLHPLAVPPGAKVTIEFPS